MCVIMFGGLYRCEGGGYWIIPYIYKAVHNPYHASMSRGDRAVASGNLSLSMRNNYDELGVDEVKSIRNCDLHSKLNLTKYYKKVGATYRNPHYPGVRLCMFSWLSKCVMSWP